MKQWNKSLVAHPQEYPSSPVSPMLSGMWEGPCVSPYTLCKDHHLPLAQSSVSTLLLGSSC